MTLEIRDAQCIHAASFVLIAELLTRKLEIRLPKDVLPGLHSQPGHVASSTAAALRLPLDGPALYGKVDSLLVPYALEPLETYSRNSAVSVSNFLDLYHGPPPRTEKTLPSLDTCTSSFPGTCARVAARSMFSRCSSHVLPLSTEALQCSMDFVNLATLRHGILSKLQTFLSVSPAKTSPGPSFSMPSRWAACQGRIFPSSQLHACPSSPSYSSQPYEVAQASLRSSRPLHVMLLHMEALQCASVDVGILDPLHLPKLQSLSCSLSVWPAQTTPWLFSKRKMPSRPATCPSRVPSSSRLRASSLTCTSIQPSQVAQGSLLLSWPPHVMPLHKEAVQRAMDSAILDPLHHETLPKLQKLSWSSTLLLAWASPWPFSKGSRTLRLSSRLSSRLREIIPAEMRACATGIHASSGAPTAKQQKGRVESVS